MLTESHTQSLAPNRNKAFSRKKDIRTREVIVFLTNKNIVNSIYLNINVCYCSISPLYIHIV